MLQFLFSFKGRVNRAKFWAFYLAWCLFGGTVGFGLITAGHFFIASGTRPPWPLTSQWSLWDVPLVTFFGVYFYAVLVVVVKRLHDRNKSALWLAFFYGVPLVSFAALRLSGRLPQTSLQPDGVQIGLFLVCTAITWWYLIELLILPGIKGDNRFGPDPKGQKISELPGI
jgi:uncharacterized membrane protein YhaH (DUF805 family)